MRCRRGRPGRRRWRRARSPAGAEQTEHGCTDDMTSHVTFLSLRACGGAKGTGVAGPALSADAAVDRGLDLSGTLGARALLSGAGLGRLDALAQGGHELLDRRR